MKLRSLLLAMSLCAAVRAQDAGLAVIVAQMRVDTAGTDSYTIEGTFHDLSFTDAGAVTFSVGNFASRIPMEKFVVDADSGRLVYEDATGLAPYWLSSLTIDPASGTFQAVAAATALSGLPNPFKLQLGNGTLSGCLIVKLHGNGDGSYDIAQGDGATSACRLAETPVIDPVTVSTPTDFNVVVTVAAEATIDDGSMALYRANDDAETQGDPLCQFTAQGNRQYACTITVAEDSAGVIPLLITASEGGSTVISPGFFLDITRPGGDPDVAQLESVEAAMIAAKQYFDQYGDSCYARVQSIIALRQLFGGSPGLTASPVGLAGDGLSIEARTDQGVTAAMILNLLSGLPPEDAPQVGANALAKNAKSGSPSSAASALRPLRPAQYMPRDAPACGEYQRDLVRNQSVLIWSLFDLWFGLTDLKPVSKPFDSNKCPSFTDNVDVVNGWSGTPQSLELMKNYGTVILETHGIQLRDGRVGLATALRDNKMPTDDPGKYGVGCVTFSPTYSPTITSEGCFVAVLPGNRHIPQLEKSVIFGGFCSSSRMAAAFVGRDSAFFGYSQPTFVAIARNDSASVFNGMLGSFLSTGEVGGDGVSSAGLNGNNKLAYLGNPKLKAAPDSVPLPYAVAPGGTLTLEATLEGAEKCDATIKYAWQNSASAGHLKPAQDNSGQDKFTTTDSQAVYTGLTSPPNPVDAITVDFLPNGGSAENANDIAARACTSVAVAQKSVGVQLTGLFSYSDEGPHNVTLYSPPTGVTTPAPFVLSDSGLGGTSKLKVEQVGANKWVVTQEVSAPDRTDIFTNTWNRVDLALTNAPGARQIRVHTESTITGACQAVDVGLAGTLRWDQELDGFVTCSGTVDLQGFSTSYGTATLSLNINALGAKGTLKGAGSGTVTTTVELLDSTDPYLN
jgi:hypothetical protein